MKKDDLLKYIVAPYNIVSASIAIFFMWPGFWNPDPNLELIAFVLRIIVFFGFIFLLLTNLSFYLRNRDYYNFSLKYNFWTQVIQSTAIRVLSFGFNIGAGTKIVVYLGFRENFSLAFSFKAWNYALVFMNKIDDSLLVGFGFNIVSIVLAIFFYKLLSAEKNNKQPV